MITGDELRASGENLGRNHSEDVLLLAAMHMTCSQLLRATGAERDENGRRMLAVLRECVAARGREIGVSADGLCAAAKDIKRSAEVLDYLDALPS